MTGSGEVLKKDAFQIVTALLELFVEYTEMAESVVALREWQCEHFPGDRSSGKSDNILGDELQKFLKVWEEGWQKQKQKLLSEEDYSALSKIKAMQQTVEAWLSEEVLLPAHEVLREFGELKSSATIKGWEEMESLLLSKEELEKAGTRQQDMHFLHGMPVELTNDLHGLQGTASTPV